MLLQTLVVWLFGVEALQLTKSETHSQAGFYWSTSVQNQCYQYFYLQGGCFGHQLSIVSVMSEFL